MIELIKIKNFKSVVDLSLELGAFNVLVGENGCGKSNILEAIAFGAAANADKLDYEFLGSRGIRLANPELMFSAFAPKKSKKTIKLEFSIGKEIHIFDITNDTKNNKKWIEKNLEYVKNIKLLEKFEDTKKKYAILIKKKISDKEQEKEIISIGNSLKKIEDLVTSIYSDVTMIHPVISNFIVYSPEQSNLRKYEETTQIYPLGIKGDGLFQYLKELALNKKNKKAIEDIKKNLTLLDWFENFELPEDLMKNEFSLKIKDKYLNEDIKFFDQRSTNEGFLFLLFYLTLLISKSTPTFFAIDNIDASFNPKLCVQLTKTLADLSKKYKKQIIVTTHNPAILDGLDLSDNNQRLFVVSRNVDGHTKAKRIVYKPERKMKLSEIWTNGYIGGLPENF